MNMPPAAPAVSAHPLGELRPLLLRYVRSRLRDRSGAEDVVQEVLLKAARAGETVRDPSRWQAWLTQVARHAVIDHLRRQRPTEPLPAHEPSTGDAGPVPAAVLEREERELRKGLARYLRGVVESLPAADREALTLVDLEGLPQVELARRLGLAPSAARSRVQRARARVRREIERCCRWEFDRYGTVIAVAPREGRRCARCN